MDNETILKLAHRICWQYRHMEDARYIFNEYTMLKFATEIIKALDRLKED